MSKIKVFKFCRSQHEHFQKHTCTPYAQHVRTDRQKLLIRNMPKRLFTRLKVWDFSFQPGVIILKLVVYASEKKSVECFVQTTCCAKVAFTKRSPYATKFAKTCRRCPGHVFNWLVSLLFSQSSQLVERKPKVWRLVENGKHPKTSAHLQFSRVGWSNLIDIIRLCICNIVQNIFADSCPAILCWILSHAERDF